MWASTKTLQRVPLAIFALDIVSISFSFFFAYQSRFSGAVFEAPNQAHQLSHITMLVAGLLLWPIALHLRGLYDVSHHRSARKIITRVLQAGLIVALLVATILFALKAKLASRLVFGLFIGYGVLSVWMVRITVAYILARFSHDVRLVIVGTGQLAVELASALHDHPANQSILSGYYRVDDSGQSELIDPADVMGNVTTLIEHLETRVVDRIVIAVESRLLTQLEALVDRSRQLGIDVVVVPEPLPAFMSHAVSRSLSGLRVMKLDASPQFRAVMAGKRIFDVLVVLLITPVAAVIMIAAGIAIICDTGFPVFFVQQRIGLNGRYFDLIKLRSMVIDAPDQQLELEHLNEVHGPAFKISNDPRVTTVGRWLRRFSIDELPQLLNVARGEMSMVGPRPPLPSEVEQYRYESMRRLSVKPGITGAWQVSNDGEPEFEKWVAQDLDYIDNWSPWLDIKILLRTIPAIIIGHRK